jgi:AcrR family transcriptional regulator
VLRVPAPPAPGTRERLLDAAEALFAERGSSATSMRSITAAARVNLAAVNYHFGSKHGLLRAVIERRVGPANQERLKLLEQVLAGESPRLEQILQAFLTPVFARLPGPELASIHAILWAEPVDVARPLIDEIFGEVGRRFSEALSAVLPHLEPDEVGHRFQFTVGIMLHALSSRSSLTIDPAPRAIRTLEQRTIAFAAAGMRAPAVEVPA